MYIPNNYFTKLFTSTGMHYATWCNAMNGNNAMVDLKVLTPKQLLARKSGI